MNWRNNETLGGETETGRTGRTGRTSRTGRSRPTNEAEDCIITVVVALIALAVMLFVFGCASTVVPGEIKASVASWDGSTQNSGLVGFDAQGNGIITLHADGRYYTLVAMYGPYFKPPCLYHEGSIPITNFPVAVFNKHKQVGTLTNGIYFRMDAEHIVKFRQMNTWLKEHRAVFGN
jgi:hypothetical protein